jgi:hypothetical protein
MCHRRIESCYLLKAYLNAAAALVGSCPEHLHPVLGERRGGGHSVAALVAKIQIKIPHENPNLFSEGTGRADYMSVIHRGRVTEKLE